MVVEVITGAVVAKMPRNSILEGLEIQFPAVTFSAVAQYVPLGTEFPVPNNWNDQVDVAPGVALATTYTGLPL